MMTLRARIFIILSVFVLVVLSISIFLFVRGKSKPADNVKTAEEVVVPNNNAIINNANTADNGGGAAIINKPIVVTDPIAVEKAGVEQLAKVFMERYQTFSSDNNYENIRQVQSMVTDNLWKNLSSRLSVPPAKTFTGITTQVFATDLISFDAKSASVSTSVRRLTTDQNGKTSSLNQNYVVGLVKTGGNWLVDSFAVAK